MATYGNSPAEIAAYKQYAAAMEVQYGIPPGLLQWQIGAESSWDPNAKNPNSTATGIAQFTNPTAQWRGVNQLDPYSSISGAADYMAYLKNVTGSWQAALNAYGTTHDNPAKAAQAEQILYNAPSDADIQIQKAMAEGQAEYDKNPNLPWDGTISWSSIKTILGSVPLILLGVVLIVLALVFREK